MVGKTESEEAEPMTKTEMAMAALQIAATRRAGLSEIYKEDISRGVIEDATVYLRWIEKQRQPDGKDGTP